MPKGIGFVFRQQVYFVDDEDDFDSAPEMALAMEEKLVWNFLLGVFQDAFDLVEAAALQVQSVDEQQKQNASFFQLLRCIYKGRISIESWEHIHTVFIWNILPFLPGGSRQSFNFFHHKHLGFRSSPSIFLFNVLMGDFE